MIKFSNCIVYEPGDQLPALTGEILYGDGETTPGERTRALEDGAFFPYRGDRLCGFAALADDDPIAHYVPASHPEFKGWLMSLMVGFQVWVNHNAKFDAHFIYCETGVTFDGRIVDTVNMAKLVDSDRFNHKLKPLCRDFCGLDMLEEKEVESFFKRGEYKDYGRLPIDLIGRYACMDVIGNRALYKELLKRLDADQMPLFESEVLFTKHLFNMERRGIRVDVQQTKLEKLKTLTRMMKAAERLRELTGHELVDSGDFWSEIFISELGLPIVKSGKTGPSFDSEALDVYEQLPEVRENERSREIISITKLWRAEQTFLSLFAEKYLELEVDGILHPSFNQSVRTGRMSCGNPNLQQADIRAKRLIIPRPGYAFLSYDASQIEFRIIVHFIKDRAAINAYRTDASTDFHEWVAALIEIGRNEGKTLNFAMAFGAGRNKATRMLMQNPDLLARVMKSIEAEGVPAEKIRETFKAMVSAAADHAYEEYHRRLPGIRQTSYHASNIAKTRGYVRNPYGRRRHLRPEFAHKAFNSVVQGSALDYTKERMLACTGKWYEERDIQQLINVHDEVLFELPIRYVLDPAVRAKIKADLETQVLEWRVPFLWDGAYCPDSWADSKLKAAAPNGAGPF